MTKHERKMNDRPFEQSRGGRYDQIDLFHFTSLFIFVIKLFITNIFIIVIKI